MTTRGPGRRRLAADPAARFVLWMLPVGLAYSGYSLGADKLGFMQAAGFRYAKWDGLTEWAVRFTVWLAENRWVFVAGAVALAIAFLAIPSRASLAPYRRLALIVAYGFAIWPVLAGMHLFRKVVIGG